MTTALGKPAVTADNLINPWVLVGLLSGAFVLNYLDRQIVFAIFPVLRREMGFSDTQLGLAGSLFTWTYSAAMPFSGRLADIFPKQRLVIGSLLLWSFATIVTGLSQNVGQFLASRVFMGLSESLYVPAAIALITHAHSATTRSKALAIHGLAQFLGITLGGWYGGWSAERFGWRTGLLSVAIVGIAYALILMRTLSQPAREPVTAERESVPARPRDLFRSVCFIAISVTFFSFCAMLWMLYAWLPTYIYERHGLSLADSGLTATLYLQSSSAVGVLLGGILGDRFGKVNPLGRFRVLAAGLFCCAPFAFATYHGDSLVLLKAGACGYGVFAGLFVSNIFASAYDVVAKRNFGLASGVINMIGGLGAGSAILFTGMLKNAVPIADLMLGASGLAMTMAVILTIVVHSNLARERERQGLG